MNCLKKTLITSLILLAIITAAGERKARIPMNETERPVLSGPAAVRSGAELQKEGVSVKGKQLDNKDKTGLLLSGKAAHKKTAVSVCFCS
jgi:hypothetical protein